MRIAFRTEEAGIPARVSPHENSRSFRIVLVITLVCSVLAILGSFLGDGGIMIVWQQSRYKRSLQARIEEEETRRARLLAKVEALRGDPYQLERVAREELGLVRRDEVVYDFRPSAAR